MRNAIRSELRKALTNRMLYIALAIGLVFCTWDVLENMGNMEEFNKRIAESKDWPGINRDTRGHIGYSLFYLWLGLGTRGGSIFYTIWPMLAAMAYGWSYLEDRRGGVYNQIAARTNTKIYYISKYIAVFVSGGLAVSVPLLLDLLANALVGPYEHIPQIFDMVNNSGFASELFYTSHWAYGLVWCGMTFLFGGVAACLCFVVGTKLRYGVMTVLVPYAVYVVWDSVFYNLRASILSDVELALSPLRIISPTPGLPNPEWLVFSVLGGLTVLSFGIGYWQVVKNELA